MRSRPLLIDVRNLTVHREDGPILRDVTWKVRAGEPWAMLGANGSGKTSLLCVLAGYMPPTSGEIAVLGRTYGASDWRELRREIGLVTSNLQQRIEGPETALETVASGRYAMLNFWGRLTRRDRKDAAKWLERVGCGALASRQWAVLSQGERQRILIARALMARPRLLILDEPCAGLDPVARARFLLFLGKLGRSPNCPVLVLVTHHIEEIIPLISHVLLLRNGAVLAQGRKAACLTTPLLSATFGARLVVDKRRGVYAARVSNSEIGTVAPRANFYRDQQKVLELSGHIDY
ncbi:MAG: ABC transporter ATP-binding protein [Verrucomicrobiales bacterium]